MKSNKDRLAYMRTPEFKAKIRDTINSLKTHKPMRFCSACNKETEWDVVVHGGGLGIIECMSCGRRE